jgi:FkbM family methyltransferase
MRKKKGFRLEALYFFLWALRLDLRLVVGSIRGDISWALSLQILFLKYLTFLRDRLTRTVDDYRSVTLTGKEYLYNDRFGVGSVQRVFAESLALTNHVKPDAVVVDAGANIGQFNLFCNLVLGAARVISIEPAPASFALLQKNALAASDCIAALIDDKTCRRRFYLAADSQLSSIICSESTQECPSVEMQTFRLDDILRVAGVDRIDLLKVDCEGNDLAVLKSAGEYLDKTGVVYVEMSVTGKSGGNIFAIGSYLESLGFRLQKLVVPDSADLSSIDGVFVRVAAASAHSARSCK